MKNDLILGDNDLSVSYHPNGFTIKEYGYPEGDHELIQIIMLSHDQADKLWRYMKEALVEVGYYERIR